MLPWDLGYSFMAYHLKHSCPVLGCLQEQCWKTRPEETDWGRTFAQWVFVFLCLGFQFTLLICFPEGLKITVGSQSWNLTWILGLNYKWNWMCWSFTLIKKSIREMGLLAGSWDWLGRSTAQTAAEATAVSPRHMPSSAASLCHPFTFLFMEDGSFFLSYFVTEV